MRKITDKTKLAAIILAVPKHDPFSSVIEFHFSRVGWKVKVFNSIDNCKKMLDSGKASMCILDYSLAESQQFVRAVKSKKETCFMPVIILFPRGRNPERADEFRVCGDEHLVEPFEIYSLLMLAENELNRTAKRDKALLHQICFQFPTTEENLDCASQFMTELLKQSHLIDEKQVAMNAAFREAVLNAAQHGNRYNRDKQIKVLYLLNPEKVSTIVMDDGEGFNHLLYLKRSESSDAVSAARERYEQGRLGGLGIMLMLKCTDRIEYNDKGNSITLTKYV
ncbi:MAG: ATP-binding protein [Planctomycetota bacterium]